MRLYQDVYDFAREEQISDQMVDCRLTTTHLASLESEDKNISQLGFCGINFDSVCQSLDVNWCDEKISDFAKNFTEFQYNDAEENFRIKKCSFSASPFLLHGVRAFLKPPPTTTEFALPNQGYLIFNQIVSLLLKVPPETIRITRDQIQLLTTYLSFAINHDTFETLTKQANEMKRNIFKSNAYKSYYDVKNISEIDIYIKCLQKLDLMMNKDKKFEKLERSVSTLQEAVNVIINAGGARVNSILFKKNVVNPNVEKYCKFFMLLEWQYGYKLIQFLSDFKKLVTWTDGRCDKYCLMFRTEKTKTTLVETFAPNLRVDTFCNDM